MALSTVIVAYDVTADSRRSALAALLQAYGDRIQKSVFMVTIGDDALDELVERATTRLDLDEDSLYIIRQCANCWQVLDFHGQASPPTPELFWAVL
ncbi:MAG: CRISPR-associated endonuclease Cas2 [Nocardioides sp.]